uniref:Putative secreted protein n=1 Tax=Amblyomma triste TaxID=251400 RepID=A0A023G1L1_AMBTT
MMQKYIFNLIILILVFGMSAGEDPTDQKQKKEYVDLYRKALSVVQKESTLKLLKISSSINKTVSACLLSKFKENETYGAMRTLQSKRNDTTITNIYVALALPTLPVRPSLRIYAQQGQLSPGWDDIQFIMHAEIQKCIIIKSVNSEDQPCALWGVSKKLTKDCMEKFDELCDGKAAIANMATCKWKIQKKKSAK